MTGYEIFVWDGDHTYFLIMSGDEEIENVRDLAAVQGVQFPIVRQYNAVEGILHGWDYLDSIIRMSGGGHFAARLQRYKGETTAEELLESASIREPDELNKGLNIPENDRR